MTESEEMYLVTIAWLVEAGEQAPIPVTRLAAELNIAPVSVNQMVRKLEETGLVCYTPYHGVELSREGQQIALKILRHRRLWEVFLTQHLAMDEGEAAELACRLEHLIPGVAGERLAAYLGNPVVTPRGLPIPTGDASIRWEDQPLSSLCPPDHGAVTRLPGEAGVQAFLNSHGIRPGAKISVLAASDEGTLLVQTSEGMVQISSKLADTIRIEKAHHS